MASFVTLIGPASLTTQQHSFKRGERREVPTQVARSIKGGRYAEKFLIELDPQANIPAHQRTGSDDNGRPYDRKVRLAAIRLAIDQVDVDDEGAWTSAGVPDCRVLTSMLGWQVLATERDQALKDTPISGTRPRDEEVVEEAEALDPAPEPEATSTEPRGAAADLPPDEPEGIDTATDAVSEMTADPAVSAAVRDKILEERAATKKKPSSPGVASAKKTLKLTPKKAKTKG